MSHPLLYPTRPPLISLPDLPLERSRRSRCYGMLESGDTSIAPQDQAPLTKRSRKILNCEPCRIASSNVIAIGHAPLDMRRSVILLTIRIHPLVHEGLQWHLPILHQRVPSMPLQNSGEIRQSLSLLESHLTTIQRAPRQQSDAPSGETRAQPQRGLLAHLSTPLSSWPTQLKPWRRADRLDIISGYADQQDESPSAGHRSPKTLLASYEQDHDLVRLMPPLAVIDALLDHYFEYCTWLYRPIDAVAFMRRWSNYNRIHLPDGHSISPGQPPVRPELGTRCYNIALMLMERHGPSTPGRDLDRIELLVARAYYLTLVTVDSEELWLLRAELVAVGTAFGLHRDPGAWSLPNNTAERRRMAWWNIVFLDRWHAFMFGRPYAISSRHFDTQLPRTSWAKSWMRPLYVPVPYGTILDHDRLLQEWHESLPADIVMDDVALAQSITAPLAATRRAGVQGAALRLAFLHARFALHRAHAGGSGSLCGETPEMATSMALAIDAANALLATGTQLHPTSLGPHAANVRCPPFVTSTARVRRSRFSHASHRGQPYPTGFPASPDKRVPCRHRSNPLCGRPFADKGTERTPSPGARICGTAVQDDERAQALRHGKCLGPGACGGLPSAATLYASNIAAAGWQPEASVSPEEVLPPPVLDLSQSSHLWAPGRSSVQNPPSQAGSSSGSDGAYVKHQHAKQHIHSQSELQGNGTGPSPQSAPVLNFEQASGLPAFKVPNTSQDSMWSSPIGFEKGELGQFFDEMDDGKRVAQLGQ
ncbi:hypothetical protein BJY52DRAFT_1191779 [Lactarius psammicola]|nr:hypothetical protein BJY52DRAFT_1191779 [Lactarius psammicola]